MGLILSDQETLWRFQAFPRPPKSAKLGTMPIRRLSEDMVNRIAAGEVVERPASVVKELVENAIDAGASRIEIVTAAGGVALIRVSDDGARHGAGRARARGRAPLHLEARSAGSTTSASLGFRGEALAAIGAAARLRARLAARGARARRYEIAVEGGRVGAAPAGGARRGHAGRGARPLLRHAGAARSSSSPSGPKPRRSPRCVKRLAMAHPEIRFALAGSDRTPLDLPAAAAPRRGSSGWRR